MMMIKNKIVKETLFQTFEFYIGWISAHFYYQLIYTTIKRKDKKHNKMIKHIFLILSFFFIFVLIQTQLNKYIFTSKYNSVGFVIGYTLYLQTKTPQVFDYYK